MTAQPGRIEKRLLQAAITVACLVPILAGAGGMMLGVTGVPGIDPAFRTNLDSHVRYLSGLLFGIGLALLCCVPNIELKSLPFRVLGAMVVSGGLARLAAAIAIGPPGPAHLFALVMELGVVPTLLIWQWRFVRRQHGKPVPR